MYQHNSASTIDVTIQRGANDSYDIPYPVSSARYQHYQNITITLTINMSTTVDVASLHSMLPSHPPAILTSVVSHTTAVPTLIFDSHPQRGRRILIPISVTGWLIFGVICILCINGQSRGNSMWLPDWYLERSEIGRRDRLALAAWYVGVVVFWPLGFVVLALYGIARAFVMLGLWVLRRGWREERGYFRRRLTPTGEEKNSQGEEGGPSREGDNEMAERWSRE